MTRRWSVRGLARSVASTRGGRWSPPLCKQGLQGLAGIQRERCGVALVDWLKHDLDNALDRG